MDEKTINLDNQIHLVKFIQKQYLNDFLNGSLFMNNGEYFNEMEKEHGKGIGDKNDSNYVFSKNTEIILKYENKEIKIPCDNPLLKLGYEKFPMFCMFCLDDRNINKSYIENNELHQIYHLDLDIKSKIKNDFNSYDYMAVIILDNAKFCNRIKLSIEENQYEYAMDIINYVDYDKDKYSIKEFNPSYFKENLFSHQQEWRLQIQENLKCPYVLNIGEIKDIVKILTLDEFLDIGLYEFKTKLPRDTSLSDQ